MKFFQKDAATKRWEINLAFWENQRAQEKANKLLSSGGNQKAAITELVKLKENESKLNLHSSGNPLTRYENAVLKKGELGENPKKAALIWLYEQYNEKGGDEFRLPSNFDFLTIAIGVRPKDFKMLTPLEFILENKKYLAETKGIFSYFLEQFQGGKLKEEEFLAILGAACEGGRSLEPSEISDICSKSIEPLLYLQRQFEAAAKAGTSPNPYAISGDSPVIYAAKNNLKFNGKLIALHLYEKHSKIADKADVFEYYIENDIKIGGVSAAQYAIDNYLALGSMSRSDGTKRGKDAVVFLQEQYDTQPDKYKIGSFSPFEYALRNNIEIYGENPVQWLLENEKKVNSKDAIDYLIENNIKWQGTPAIESLIKDNVEIEGQHIAVYLQQRFNSTEDIKYLIDGLEPMDYALRHGIENNNLKNIIESFEDTTEKISVQFNGTESIKYLQGEWEKNKTLMDDEGIEPIRWALQKQRQYYYMIKLDPEFVKGWAQKQPQDDELVVKAKACYDADARKGLVEARQKIAGTEPVIYLQEKFELMKGLALTSSIAQKKIVGIGEAHAGEIAQLNRDVEKLEKDLETKVIAFFQNKLNNIESNTIELQSNALKLKEELEQKKAEKEMELQEIDQKGQKNHDEIKRLETQMLIKVELDLGKKLGTLVNENNALEKRAEELETEIAKIDQEIEAYEFDIAGIGNSGTEEAAKFRNVINQIQNKSIGDASNKGFKDYAASKDLEIKKMIEAIDEIDLNITALEDDDTTDLTGFALKNAEHEMKNCLVGGMQPIRYMLNKLIENPTESILIDGVDVRIYALMNEHISIQEFISFMDFVPEQVQNPQKGATEKQIEASKNAIDELRKAIHALPRGQEEKLIKFIQSKTGGSEYESLGKALAEESVSLSDFLGKGKADDPQQKTQAQGNKHWERRISQGSSSKERS